MQCEHATVTGHDEQEEPLRHVEPCGDEQTHEHDVDRHAGERRGEVDDAEHVGVAQGLAKGVLETRLQIECPFEADGPDDRQREFRNEQWGDLQHDPRIGDCGAADAEDEP